MPTPSNNPPPELPPRSYSSSCPDDVRAPAQAPHRHATPGDSDAMQVDNHDRTPTPSAPSSSSASTSHGPIRAVPPPPSGPPVAIMTDEDSEADLEEDELMGLLHDLSGPDESGLDESQPESLEEDEVRGLFNGLSRHPESRSGVDTAQTSPQSAGPDDECHHENGAAAGEASSKVQETRGTDSGSRDRHTIPASEMHGDMPDELVSLIAEDNENRRMLQSFELPPMGYETTNMRILPTLSSSFLRPGSMFKGTQQSEKQIYVVEVEIKNVDLRESFLCGYLKIYGLTEENPCLTTYFESEIIGPQYGFLTKHDSWGATDKIDLNHWNKFSAFRPYAKQAKRGSVHIQHPEAQENIFMRWKELFLVPNHRIVNINGASFEGFYYICFNQREGCISGIYYHARSEKFQQLELKHVDDRGCFAAMELR